MARKNKKFQNGQVSFTPDDLKNAAQSGTNGIAYNLLWQAATTSSNVKSKDAQAGLIKNFDDIYPTSPEECDEMQNLLDQAKAAVGDSSDTKVMGDINEFQDIINWSRQRHWNFQWVLIVGCIIFAIFMNYRKGKATDVVNKNKAKLEEVKNWEEGKMAVIPSLEDLKDQTMKHSMDSACCAEWHKMRLYNTAYYYNNAVSREEEYQSMLDTVTSKDRRKSYEQSIKNYKEKQKEYKKEFEGYQKMSAKDVHNDAISYHKDQLSTSKKGENKTRFWFIYLIILIPLYIFAARPYGWMESRHRTEKKTLDWIQRVGLTVAGFFFGTGILMNFLPEDIVITRWSDGHTTREDNSDAPNMVIMGMKIVLMIVGVAIFCLVSVFIMTYATIAGLIRNYEWKSMFGTNIVLNVLQGQ